MLNPDPFVTGVFDARLVGRREYRPVEKEANMTSEAELTRHEIDWLFPVIQIASTGSALEQITEERRDIGTGDNGLAVGVKRIITTHRRINPSE